MTGKQNKALAIPELFKWTYLIKVSNVAYQNKTPREIPGAITTRVSHPPAVTH